MVHEKLWKNMIEIEIVENKAMKVEIIYRKFHQFCYERKWRQGSRQNKIIAKEVVFNVGRLEYNNRHNIGAVMVPIIITIIKITMMACNMPDTF